MLIHTTANLSKPLSLLKILQEHLHSAVFHNQLSTLQPQPGKLKCSGD